MTLCHTPLNVFYATIILDLGYQVIGLNPFPSLMSPGVLYAFGSEPSCLAWYPSTSMLVRMTPPPLPGCVLYLAPRSNLVLDTSCDHLLLVYRAALVSYFSFGFASRSRIGCVTIPHGGTFPYTHLSKYHDLTTGSLYLTVYSSSRNLKGNVL